MSGLMLSANVVMPVMLNLVATSESCRRSLRTCESKQHPPRAVFDWMSHQTSSQRSYQGDFNRSGVVRHSWSSSSQRFLEKQCLDIGLRQHNPKAASSTWSQVYLQTLLNPSHHPRTNLTTPGNETQYGCNVSAQHRNGALQFSVQGHRSISRSESIAEDVGDDAGSTTRIGGRESLQQTSEATPSTEWFRSIRHSPPEPTHTRPRCVSPSLFQVPASRTAAPRQDRVAGAGARQAVVLMQQRSRCLSSAQQTKSPATAHPTHQPDNAALLPPVHRSRYDTASKSLRLSSQPEQHALTVAAAPSQAPSCSLTQPLQQPQTAALQTDNLSVPVHALTQGQGTLQLDAQDDSDAELDSQDSTTTDCSLQGYSTPNAAVAMTTASSSGLDFDDNMSADTSQTATDSFADTDSFHGMLSEGFAVTVPAGDALAPLLGPSLMGTAPTVAFVGVQPATGSDIQSLTPLR